MPKLYDFETHLPVNFDEAVPTDERLPKEEHSVKEESYSFDEYNEKYKTEPESSEKRHSRLKDLFLKPALSVILTSVIVISAFGRDPLGNDFLGRNTLADNAVSDSSSTSSVTSETENNIETDNNGDDTEETTPVETEPDVPIEEDDVFPELDNLYPDFAGEFAWSGDGSEEYLRFANNGDAAYSYLVKGSAWDIYDEDGKMVQDPSAVYDESSNTLKLNGFSADYLDVNLMGNGFTVELNGENSIGNITVWGAMYGGSIKFVGDGSLTVTNGIMLNCEDSASCIMIGRGVTLDVRGENAAIAVLGTTLEGDGIYVSKYLSISEGEVSQFGEIRQTEEGRSAVSYSIVDANGDPLTHVRIEPVK